MVGFEMSQAKKGYNSLPWVVFRVDFVAGLKSLSSIFSFFYIWVTLPPPTIRETQSSKLLKRTPTLINYANQRNINFALP